MSDLEIDWSVDVRSGKHSAQKTTKVNGALVKGLENVFVSGKFSNLIITCKDRTWKAHKVVVCTQSALFAKACGESFKEAVENAIDLPDDEPEVVDAILYYCYHFDIKEKENGLAPLLLLARVFALADKYLIEPLRDLVTEKFHVRADSEWNTDTFIAAMSEVYIPDFEANNADLLRLNILEVVERHAKELFHGVEHQNFRAAAAQTPEFFMAYSKDVTLALAPKATLPSVAAITWYRCPGNSCRRNTTVFGVGSLTPKHFHMSCPLRCEKDRNMDWWSTYKTIA